MVYAFHINLPNQMIAADTCGDALKSTKNNDSLASYSRPVRRRPVELQEKGHGRAFVVMQ